MYAKCGSLEHATVVFVFDQTAMHNISSRNMLKSRGVTAQGWIEKKMEHTWSKVLTTVSLGVALIYLWSSNRKDSVEEEEEEEKEKKEGEEKEEEKTQGLEAQIESGNIEAYGDYVVRQIGISKESAEGKRLWDVAMAYLRSNSDHGLEKLGIMLCAMDKISETKMKHLAWELKKELDACMISYLAYHWRQSSILRACTRSEEQRPKLRSLVMAATRKQRFHKVMDTLKTQRTFTTLVEQLRAIRKVDRNLPLDGDVVVAADSSIRNPVLLMIGGGMGAGKSTVVKNILGGTFWSSVSQHAVIVEADAFKEKDVVYLALISYKYGDGDIAEASQLVHESSTQAAQSLLVSALNEGRDVIFDGTMSWEPFVMQTIEMARGVHLKRYRMGPGFVRMEDGTSIEKYWEPMEPDIKVETYKEYDKPQRELPVSAESRKPDAIQQESSVSTESRNPYRIEEESSVSISVESRKPYRIELVGVTCDPLLAIVRGIKRAMATKRAVPIDAQLRSHKLFATSLERYCSLVDEAKIYSTSDMDRPPELIGYKNRESKLLVNVEAFEEVNNLMTLNADATSISQLHGDGRCNKLWKEIVLSRDRDTRQQFLRHVLASQECMTSPSSSPPPPLAIEESYRRETCS